MPKVRNPAVAGMFYPADPRQLHAMVQQLLAEIAEVPPGSSPKAVIAPHAGYVYSGSVAAAAYARLTPLRGQVTRVVLLGPSHRVGFHGLATTSAELYRSPLGDIPIDREAIAALADLSQVRELDQAHAMEHSLEVHLPFLQEVLGEFSLVPLVVGDSQADEVGQVLERLWGGPETLVVVSSDLSHYHDYTTARRRDEHTAHAIGELKPEEIHYDDACGRNPINGLLTVARKLGLKAELADLRNSGDTAGPRDSVVGYGAWLFH